MTVHFVKTEKEYYRFAIEHVKTFEVRKNDRDYKVGDLLCLAEIDNGKKTGLHHYFLITYILNDTRFVKDGFVILGIKDFV